MQRDEDQETISVDNWIVFQAARHTAKLVQVSRCVWGDNMSVVMVGGSQFLICVSMQLKRATPVLYLNEKSDVI